MSSVQQAFELQVSSDAALEEVREFFEKKPGLVPTLARALRQSFDEVIDGPRTGRYCIEQLEKTEKTYIGTKVEIVLRDELQLPRGLFLDNLICGHEVDTKFSLTGAWMIPREAIGHLCLVVQASDNDGIFSVGLLRMNPEVLTNGANQDGKKSVSAAGKKSITWIIERAQMQRNFLLDLDDSTRKTILSPTVGRQRLWALFRNVTGQIIPRTAILQVAQLKGDPLKRARESKAILEKEHLLVLCATYKPDQEKFRQFGFADFESDDWLSIKLDSNRGEQGA